MSGGVSTIDVNGNLSGLGNLGVRKREEGIVVGNVLAWQSDTE